jgi:hypothetical protein
MSAESPQMGIIEKAGPVMALPFLFVSFANHQRQDYHATPG